MKNGIQLIKPDFKAAASRHGYRAIDALIAQTQGFRVNIYYNIVLCRNGSLQHKSPLVGKDLQLCQPGFHLRSIGYIITTFR